MNKFSLAILLLMSLSLPAQAQVRATNKDNTCPGKYYAALKKGRAHLNKNDYNNALQSFLDAQVAQKECNILTDSATGYIKKTFDAINAKKDEAERKTREAQSQVLSGMAMVSFYKDSDPTTSFRYAQYAYEKDNDNVNAQTALLNSYYTDPENTEEVFRTKSFEIGHNWNEEGYLSPDGKVIAGVSAETGKLELFNSETNKRIAINNGDWSAEQKRGKENAIAYWSPNDVRFIANNCKLLFGQQSTSIKLWDINSNKELSKINFRQFFYPNLLPISNDGKKVLVRDDNEYPVIWDVGADTAIQFNEEAMGMQAGYFSKDGKLIVAETSPILVINAESGELIAQLDTNIYGKVSISSDAKRLVVLGLSNVITKFDEVRGKPIITDADVNIVLWDIANKKTIAAFPGDKDDRNAIPVVCNEKILILTQAKTEEQIWEWNNNSGITETGQIVRENDFLERTHISVWDYKNNTKILSFDGCQSVYSDDETRLVVIDGDTVKTFNTDSMQLISRFYLPSKHYNSIKISSDNKKIICAEGHNAFTRDLITGKQLLSLHDVVRNVDRAYFSTSGNGIITVFNQEYLRSGSTYSTARVVSWLPPSAIVPKLSTKIILPTYIKSQSDPYSKMNEIGEVFYDPHEDKIAVPYLDDSGHLVIATVEVRSLEISRHIYRGKIFSGTNCRFVCTQMGRKVAFAINDSTAEIWDRSTEKIITIAGIPNITPDIVSGEFTSDGQIFVYTGKLLSTKTLSTTTIKWNADNGKLIGKSTDQTKITYEEYERLSSPYEVALTLTPNGKMYLQSIENDGTALYDVKTRKKVLPLGAYKDIYTSCFSPDANSLFIVSRNSTDKSTVSLWNLRTGANLMEVPAKGEIIYATFSSDGKNVYTVTRDGEFRVWLVSIEDIINTFDKNIEDLSSDEKIRNGIPTTKK